MNSEQGNFTVDSHSQNEKGDKVNSLKTQTHQVRGVDKVKQICAENIVNQTHQVSREYGDPNLLVMLRIYY